MSEYHCADCDNHYEVFLLNGDEQGGPIYCPYCGGGSVDYLPEADPVP